MGCYKKTADLFYLLYLQRRTFYQNQLILPPKFIISEIKPGLTKPKGTVNQELKTLIYAYYTELFWMVSRPEG